MLSKEDGVLRFEKTASPFDKESCDNSASTRSRFFQQEDQASLVVEERFLNTMVVPRASPAHRAMLRSQGGPLSGLPFTTLPLSPLQRFDSHLFRVLLLRRLHLPLPLSSALAGVVVHTTALAITVQVARGQGFLGGAASHWSLLWLGSCARLAPESQ